MKNKYRCFLMLLITAGTAVLSSCSSHHHDCAPLEEVIGIYQLTELKWNDLDDPNIQVNEMETYHALGYLIVTGQQYGYAYYKDDETAERCSFINIEYGLDEEESTEQKPMYTYINYNWEYSVGHCRNTMYHPGFSEPQLGVQRKSHKLTYNSAKQRINIFKEEEGYYNRLHVEYTRISEKTTFSEFKQLTGLNVEEPELPVIPE